MRVTKTVLGVSTGDCGGLSSVQCTASFTGSVVGLGTTDVSFDCNCEMIEWFEMGTLKADRTPVTLTFVYSNTTKFYN